MFKRLTVITVALLFCTTGFAQTIGNTSDPKVPYGAGIMRLKDSGIGPLKLSFDFNNIFDKDLKADKGISNAELDGQEYMLRLGYNIADRFEPYVKFGVVNLKTKWDQSNKSFNVRSDQGIGAGLGAKFLAYEIPEHRIRLSLDAQYFHANPDIKDARIDGTQPNISATEFKVTQWHIAAIASMEFVLGRDKDNPAAPYSFIPYMGIAYTDSITKVSFKADSTSYDTGDLNNDNNFLFITGCDITSPEDISLNIEGRFIGETAGSGGCTVKF
jgi:opacity protein-like surface antigen